MCPVTMPTRKKHLLGGREDFKNDVLGISLDYVLNSIYTDYNLVSNVRRDFGLNSRHSI